MHICHDISNCGLATGRMVWCVGVTESQLPSAEEA